MSRRQHMSISSISTAAASLSFFSNEDVLFSTWVRFQRQISTLSFYPHSKVFGILFMCLIIGGRRFLFSSRSSWQDNDVQCKNDKLYEVFCSTFDLYLAKYTISVSYCTRTIIWPWSISLGRQWREGEKERLLVDRILFLIRIHWPFASRSLWLNWCDHSPRKTGERWLSAPFFNPLFTKGQLLSRCYSLAWIERMRIHRQNSQHGCP